MCCKSSVNRIWYFGCSTVILLVALCLGLLWPPIAIKILYQKLVLEEGSLNYVNWKETPIPMYLEFYMFNWTNSEDILNHNVKPKFEQIGPYVFSEKHFRDNITWHDNFTVTFYQKRTWHFVPEKSINRSLDDIITCLNPIVATVTHITRNKSPFLKGLINEIFRWSNSNLTVSKSVRELLFDGYDDQVLDLLTKLPPQPDLPVIPFKKFGWFVDRNESLTYDGNFTMFTGKDDIFKLGILEKWNNSPNVSFYSGKCSQVRGTTGELWPPISHLHRPNATIFATDFCRSVTLKYSGETEKYGIRGFKWIGDDSVFDNGQKYPEAKCWCTNSEEECSKIPTGVFDASACKFGAPAYASYPHFYLADPSYSEAVTGLYPNQGDHEFSVAMEPTTGIPLFVKAQLQISLMLEEISGFK